MFGEEAVKVFRGVFVSAVVVLLGSASQAQTAISQPLAGGVMVELGNDWNLTSMPNPAMNFPEIKKLVSDAQEIRMRKGNTGILISIQTYKAVKGKSLDSYDVAEYAVTGAKQFYLSQAVETEATVEKRTNGNVDVALVTLHARSGQAFRVRGGYPGGCVSTGNIRRGWSILVVSIASDSCESETHRAAQSAFLNVHE